MTKARENSDYTGLQGDLALKSPVASPSFTGKVGIGSSSPVRQLEIKDDGTLGQAIVGIIADAGDAAGIFMGTTSNNNAGGVRYFTDTNKLTLRANDEDRLLIDSAGIVTKPYQPAFDVYRSDSSYNSGTTTASLNLNAARHNIGNHYNLSSRRFVAPVAGLYQFNFRTIVSGATNNAHLRMYKNGSQLQGGDSHYSSSNGSWGNWSYSLSTLLSANDYIEISTGATETIHGNSYQTFNGYLIG